MSIQHETGEKHVLKAKAAYAKPKIIGNKESGAGQPHTANKYPTQKDRKTQENTRNFAACTLLYTI